MTEVKEQETKKDEKEIEDLSLEDLSIKQLIEIEACTRCGECLNWCPAYDGLKEENVLPRFKIDGMKTILRKKHNPFYRVLYNLIGKNVEREKFLNGLYACTVCGQCHIVCPAKINTINLWEDTRQVSVENGFGPLKEHDVFVKSIINYRNPWLYPRARRDKWAKDLTKEMRKKEKELKIKDLNKEDAKILFFVGCTASYDPHIKDVAINTVKIFNEAGVDFGILGKKEQCCASTLLRVGEVKKFKEIANENFKTFNELGVELIVTSCAGCFKTLSQDYPKFGELKPKVMHTIEFIDELIEEGKLEFKKAINKVITYHDPCHLGRHTNVYDPPRRVLESITGIELIEMERNREYSRCCGAGGGLKPANPHLAERLSESRVEDAREINAEELVTACPFCYQSLQNTVKMKKLRMEVSDITKLVSEALGLNDE
ncbi:MAG: (Fe-S)-binding protein [Candidatus Hydrothermarchaeota archaeon]